MYVNLKGILNLVVFFIKLYKHRALNEVAFLCQLVLQQHLCGLATSLP